MLDYVLLGAASFFAGLVDAVVGGGGLILIPALFSLFPHTHPATLFGTNKVGSICGTTSAVWRYARSVSIEWAPTLPAVIAAFVFSFVGAWMVTVFPPDQLRKALPFVLAAVALYTFYKKQLGVTHAPRLAGWRQITMGLALGGVVGFYDGFFGPGTGSFLVFGFVRLFGFDFLKASISSKVVNIATNAAALLLFGLKGHVWWQVGLMLAVCNIAGAQIGSRLAIKHGAGFVRKLFLVVVCLLILKTGYDAFVR
ncbi:sulfite exporter TauE/SafE family protein [Parvibium lacunae]|uniref:Probable membrane transporter protein n=1 Tax=Parvibium lacunae TaxID=1888893 RepID=A0A368L0R6_9BURK|nr:TSUP family transporter [Parvibium lacunae]RCS57035.1 sulfite exporter TauE/SafE family protein [Parvibium lacunae]